MIKRKDGFTFVELMITMATFVLVMAAVSVIFTGLLTQFKQQSKIAETNIEGIVGLEILRQDIEHAGYGLPWVIPAAVAYSEAAAGYNDCAGAAPCNPPRAILSGNDAGFNNSDYLVIKAVNVAINDACKKWTTLRLTGTRTWTPDRENVNKNDDGTTNNNVRVIDLSLGSTDANSMSLVVNGAAFSTTYSSITSAPWQPTEANETRIVYGVDSNTNLRMPFNRADYFIEPRRCSINRTPCNNNSDCAANEVCELPRCARNTGVLVKAVVSHDDGDFDLDEDGTDNLMPLLDCVADMQVIYGMDNDEDGDFDPVLSADGYSADITTLTAQQIRNRVKQVRVYILAHEGQYDRDYTYPNSTVTVGEFGIGSNFNLSTTIGTNWQNYRWKVYTLVVKPNNLR